MLIVFSGLPGSGKTTLSRPVATALRAVWLRIDAIESAMWRSGVDAEQPTGLASYAVAHTVADAHLSIGATVVIDAVNAVEPPRAAWRELAARHAVPQHVVHVVCADAAEHRRRVEQRVPEPDQLVQPSWEEVRTREFEPWAEPHLLVDTSTGDTPERVARVLGAIRARGAVA
ncbi:kinase [Catellatospora sp. IY07-71]|uniref:AAA family ATPase n=1 Tax=Catellatospora sp. IY07-71 TaxID=2728827 RepID=UPI001BB3FFED|nr:AAA family ATPase [Catellatospora sp. IY07-71]BCJ77191.1 kinase [Catellatospora sp. IY07-71]